MSRLLLGLVVAVAGASVVAACSAQRASDSSGGASTEVDAGDAGFPEIVLAPETQRSGDPAKGYHALVNEPIVPCGIPMTAYSTVFGPAPESDRVEGREGANATLSYRFTAMTTKEGVALATSNCLVCHAGRINGQLVVGLGDADGDYTSDVAAQSRLSSGVGLLLNTAEERAEWQKWKARMDVAAPFSVLSTRGPNPADDFTLALFAHHDPKTMAWSDKPLVALPEPEDLPVDVPPWWRMKKKSSMFYNGAGRGDHARIMMTASILCTSSVEESRAIDALFPDIRAYIMSIVPPAYPYAVDQALAGRGHAVFDSTCSRCHGTYGDAPTYPNRLVTLAEIGTDPVLASGSAEFETRFTDWYNGSFFGEMSRLEPQAGYLAPPLDGIWATAPFLHNGSVPTIEALLDSSKRPTYFTRSFDSKDYDARALGWKFTALSKGKDQTTNVAAKKALYDTTLRGYGNAGHTFGDVLTPDDRAAVLEYLKTL